MSNTIRYDSLLVRHLARELDAELRGQRITAAAFIRDQHAVSLQFQDRTLQWDVQSGGPAWSSAAADPDWAVTLPRQASVRSVSALPDERVLHISLTGRERANAAHAIVIELLGGQRNAIALDAQERVLKQLSPQGRTRQQRGQPYAPPAGRSRRGAAEILRLDEWLELLRPVPVAERARKLIDGIAYASRINAAALLEPAELAVAFERYRELLTAEPTGFLTRVEGQPQPYGHSLWQPDAVQCASLIDAIGSLPETAATGPPAVSRLQREIESAQRKLARLESESSEASVQSIRLRADADLVLANAHAIKRGSRAIELLGFDGAPVRLELDPSLNGVEQAQSWYEKARKRERAAERLPPLIHEAKQELAQLSALLARARAGEPIELSSSPPPQRKRSQPAPSLPYRRYRTTGGLEVRVGRSSRANDELTLRHSAPHDIWLHARQTGGAHVVLRWTDVTAPPPRQDLIQAATLAALHSKARHAGTVPVDWTRRKYVRKRRGSPAGQVMVDRAKTVFVEPRVELEEELRWKEGTK